MKILFVMRHFGYVRNYESVLRQLAADGHQVHIASELERNKMGEDSLGQALARELPAITLGRAPVPEDGIWSRLATVTRLIVDYTRYIEPEYRSAPALRTRALRVVPQSYRPFLRLLDRLGHRPARIVSRTLCALERIIPLSPGVTEFLRAQAPDAMLVTPLVEPGSIQVDYIKSARMLGIPSALCVASWDNLTNKGAIRVSPDRVFVWNESQAAEAVSLHRVPRERVVVTGAQIFDHWFAWRPSRTREEFCRDMGLDPARPIILYLGSSSFIAPNEAEFGLRWLTALRLAADGQVAGANILIRPHPSNARQWSGLDLESWPHTAVWPPAGVDMFAPQFKFDFFDSMHYSAAVVGVNTSAQIEAAIVGRVVCTVQTPDFAHSQAGTLHFQYLAGRLLEVARDFDEHVAQLGAILRDGSGQAARSRAFVESFVRPFGIDQPATRGVAAAILGLPGVPRARQNPDAVPIRALRGLLHPVAWLVAGMPDRRPWWVYVLRPALWTVVQAWAIPYRVSAWSGRAAAETARVSEEAVKSVRTFSRRRWRGVTTSAKATRKTARRTFARVAHRVRHPFGSEATSE
jgi:hypothetical protein